MTLIKDKNNALPYLTGLIPVAYMASVQIYKIWYIATAAVLLLLPWFARPSWREVFNFLSDAKWFILYWIAVAVSVITSTNPARSQLFFLADLIYPCVFLIFYLVGLRSRYDAIERMMRLQVWGALAVLVITIDIKVEQRIGYRLVFVLAYFVPFIVTAICRGSKLAIVELALLTTLLLLTNSRTQIGVAMILAALSMLVFRTSLRQLLLQSASVAGVLLVLLAGAMQIPVTSSALLLTFVRTTSQPVGEVQVPTDDHTREHIDQVVTSIVDQGGWTGIGYSAFGTFYKQRWNDYADMSLHSIYQVWWLEMGYLGAGAAFLMLAFYFLRMYQARSDVTVQACSLGTIGALIAGGFHQMHQAPMLYVMLGMGLGAARQLFEPKQRAPVDG